VIPPEEAWCRLSRRTQRRRRRRNRLSRVCWARRPSDDYHRRHGVI
jgi:hypothetical protein